MGPISELPDLRETIFELPELEYNYCHVIQRSADKMAEHDWFKSWMNDRRTTAIFMRAGGALLQIRKSGSV